VVSLYILMFIYIDVHSVVTVTSICPMYICIYIYDLVFVVSLYTWMFVVSLYILMFIYIDVHSVVTVTSIRHSMYIDIRCIQSHI
jgi:hypothetical protein